MNNSGKSSEGLNLQDEVLVIKNIEFGPHDYIVPKMLSYCDGRKVLKRLQKLFLLMRVLSCLF